MSRTIRALRRLRPDVVHVHEPLAPGSSLAALLAGPRPIVATFHRAGSDVLYRGEGLVLRPFAHRLDATVAVSEAAKATAGQVLGHHVGAALVIPNGVDVRRFLDMRTDGSTSAGPSDKPSPLTILFVGRHEERKGLVVLLEAFELLRQRTRVDREVGGAGQPPAPRLLVVGEGPETTELKERFADLADVEWLGAVDDGEKARLLGSSDVFVAPSVRGESFGVVLLEAMAAGAPVIASDLPGYRLAAGKAARLVPVGDARALAEALAALLGDSHERARLVGLAEERVKGYSLDVIAEQYRQLYASLVDDRP
jgi:phosphatidylinositol alpha-mannosyltransferase